MFLTSFQPTNVEVERAYYCNDGFTKSVKSFVWSVCSKSNKNRTKNNFTPRLKSIHDAL